MIASATSFISSSVIIILVVALHLHYHLGGVLAAPATTMFVFGDSYADTGNRDPQDPQLNIPWQSPYGKTIPGQPTGRFSDGAVLTDYVAKVANLGLPLNYRNRDSGDLTAGMNFAFGGSGVFETYGPEYVTIPTQVSEFDGLSGNWTPDELAAALTLYVLCGNDYAAYYLKPDATMEGLLELVPKVVDQMVADIKNLYTIGMRRVVITYLQPIGCLPFITAPKDYPGCNDDINQVVQQHNQLLYKGMLDLYNSLQADIHIVFLDQYYAFSTIIYNPNQYGFQDTYRACCAPTSAQGGCAFIDANGNPLYTLCSDVSTNFWWDNIHPSTGAWTQLMAFFKDDIESVLT